MRHVLCVAAICGLMMGVSVAARAADEKQADKPAGPDAGKLFEQLDANKDGQVTKDEVGAEKAGLFKRLVRRGDANKDGQLTRDELAAGLAESKNDPPAPDGPPPGEGPNPEVMFQRLDKNGDGKIVLEEVPEPRRDMFEKIIARGDKDGDKALSKEEFTSANAALRKLGDGARPNPGQLLERLKKADTNGDGKLSKDEAPERMKENFARIDTNGDGQLDKDELKKHVDMMAARLGPGEKKPENKPAPKPKNEKKPK